MSALVVGVEVGECAGRGCGVRVGALVVGVGVEVRGGFGALVVGVGVRVSALVVGVGVGVRGE